MPRIDCKSLNLSIEFKDLLINFTLEALMTEPNNLNEFAAEYFQNLLNNRSAKVQNMFIFDNKLDNIVSRTTSSLDNLDDLDTDMRNKCSRRVGISSESMNPNDLAIQQLLYIPINPIKSDEEKMTLKRLISKVSIFKTLDTGEMEEVISAMNMMRVKTDQVIIKQGDEGDNFYVIESGQFDVFITNSSGFSEYISTYNNQGSFGELALLYNCKRSATIVAKTPGTLWFMDRKTFKRIVILKSHIKRLKCLTFISSVSLFDSLNSDEKMNIADVINMKTFLKDSSIINQGEKGEHMFFIESGTVAVIIESNNVKKQICTLGKGQYFGELSLLTNRPRAATVIAIENTVVAILERSSFERMLGPCIEILQRNALNYENIRSKTFGENFTIKKL